MWQHTKLVYWVGSYLMHLMSLYFKPDSHLLLKLRIKFATTAIVHATYIAVNFGPNLIPDFECV